MNRVCAYSRIKRIQFEIVSLLNKLSSNISIAFNKIEIYLFIHYAILHTRGQFLREIKKKINKIQA